MKILARLGAFVLLAAALAGAAFELRRDGAPSVIVSDSRRGGSDPLAADLLRCREIGAAAANDVRCRNVWAESRRRFLGPSASPPASAPPNTPLASDLPMPTKAQSPMEGAQPSRGSDAGDDNLQRRDAE